MFAYDDRVKYESVARAEAQREIDAEDFRVAVDKLKVRLRARRWWHAILPFRIVIVRRET